MKELRRHGFLDWMRRYELGGQEGKGRPPRQTSNAYRLCLPPAAAIMLGLFGQDAPLPDDAALARAEAAALVAVQERDGAERLAEDPADVRSYAHAPIEASPALLRTRLFASSLAGLNPKVDQNS